jgi:BMFP domain-containing protein YqiC
MQKDSRMFDDFAKLASGAMDTFSDMKREIEASMLDRMEKIMGRMHLVRREEFEVVRRMAEKARSEQEALAAKVALLEKQLRKESVSDSE